MKNRFKGFCYGCEDFVPAGEGIYESGEVFCTEPVDLQQVPESLRDRYKLTVKRWAVCWKRVNPILGTDFATVEDLRKQTKAEYEANLPTPEEIAANRAAAKEVMKEHARIRRQELADFKKRNVCTRCDGAGGRDAWLHTGWTCHRCFGSGKYS